MFYSYQTQQRKKYQDRNYQKVIIIENLILSIVNDEQNVIAHAKSIVIIANNFSNNC